MQRVGIFRLSFPEPSETFIVAQAGALSRYAPVVITRRQRSSSAFEVMHGSENPLQLKRYLLTRNPNFFEVKEMRSLCLIHAHFGVDGVYAVPLAKKLNIPLVVTFHGYDAFKSARSLTPWRSVPNANFLLHLRDLKSYASKFLAVSDSVYDALVRKGFPREKIERHYIGVDSTFFSPDADRHQPKERVILVIGRLVASKGIDDIIRAFSLLQKSFTDARLHIVGGGAELGSLKELVLNLGLQESVLFLGVRNRDEIRDLLRKSAVFALASKDMADGYKEALGIVFNEASAVGVPIVATRCGGIPEVVQDGVNGFLVAQNSPADLAKAISTILSDRELSARLSVGGVNLVKDRFSLISQTKKLENIYDNVLRS